MGHEPARPEGAAYQLQASRWMAEALYVMWKAGITMVTWLDIRDHPYPQNAVQSGLYFAGPTLHRTGRSRRCPPSASRSSRTHAKAVFSCGAAHRGESPDASSSTRLTGRWKQRAFLTANANGIFTGMVKGTKTGFVRAQLVVGGKAANGRSLGFSLKQPPDRLIPIFGSGG